VKINYSNLWKLLIDKKMTKQTLSNITSQKLSSATMAKLSKGENVNTEVLLRICKALNCGISDIMEIEQE
jgi:DNA-binding Xre family transcriptional regulator